MSCNMAIDSITATLPKLQGQERTKQEQQLYSLQSEILPQLNQRSRAGDCVPSNIYMCLGMCLCAVYSIAYCL